MARIDCAVSATFTLIFLREIYVSERVPQFPFLTRGSSDYPETVYTAGKKGGKGRIRTKYRRREEDIFIPFLELAVASDFNPNFGRTVSYTDYPIYPRKCPLAHYSKSPFLSHRVLPQLAFGDPAPQRHRLPRQGGHVRASVKLLKKQFALKNMPTCFSLIWARRN